MHGHADAGGQYAFDHPSEWRIEKDEGRSELRSPDGVVTFSFGPAPDGALDDAAAAVAERAATDGADLRIVSSHEETTAEGLRAWVIGGIADTEAARDDRFLAISVEAPGGNQGILVRFPSGPAVVDLLPEIERVLSSYRVAHG